MFKRFTRKSESHAEVTHASVAADSLQRALNTTQVPYELSIINIIQLALEQLKHALVIGEGVLGADELQLAKTYIRAMEKLQHDVETKTNKLQSRSSVEDLLLRDDAPAHTAKVASQPQVIPSGENQKRPGSCPQSTPVPGGASYLPIWNSAQLAPPPSNTSPVKQELEMKAQCNFQLRDEPATQFHHPYKFGESTPRHHAAGYQHEFPLQWTPGNAYAGQPD